MELQFGAIAKANYFHPLNRNLDKALARAIWSEQNLFCGFGFVLCHNVTRSLNCEVALPVYKDL